MSDHYLTLGISKDASADAVQKAYRAFALKWHPDRHIDDKEKAEAEFKKGKEAYDVLSDSKRREQYDNPKSFQPFFEQMPQGQMGRPVQIALMITLEEVYLGPTKVLEYARQVGCTTCNNTGVASGKSPTRCSSCNGSGHISFTMMHGTIHFPHPCPTCGGSGQRVAISDRCVACNGMGSVLTTERLSLRVPHGILDGAAITFSKMGHAGRNGGGYGDAVIFVQIAPHSSFTRINADDLKMECSVSVTQMLLGGIVRILSLKEELEVVIPKESKTNTVLRVEGVGFRNSRTGTTGSLLVVLRVQMPQNLTARQRQLMEEFAFEEASKHNTIEVHSDDGKAI